MSGKKDEIKGRIKEAAGLLQTMNDSERKAKPIKLSARPSRQSKRQPTKSRKR